MIRIAFDIGGVLSKYPDIFCPLVSALLASTEVEVYVVSDMKPHEKAVAFCRDNGFTVPPKYIVCADYEQHGEMCKAVVCEQLGIDILIDDFAGYVATIGKPSVRLLVMPDPTLPYYADSWVTDGSEGNFGRRNPPGSNRPPEDRGRDDKLAIQVPPVDPERAREWLERDAKNAVYCYCGNRCDGAFGDGKQCLVCASHPTGEDMKMIIR